MPLHPLSSEIFPEAHAATPQRGLLVPFYRGENGDTGAMRLVRVTQAARGRTTLTRDLGLLGPAPSPEHTAWRKQSSAGLWLCSKPLQIFKNLPLLLTVKSGQQKRMGVQSIASRGKLPGSESQPYSFPAGDSCKTLNPTDAQCFQLKVRMPKALASWSCCK